MRHSTSTPLHPALLEAAIAANSAGIPIKTIADIYGRHFDTIKLALTRAGHKIRTREQVIAEHKDHLRKAFQAANVISWHGPDSAKRIVADVATQHGVSLPDITGPSRRAPIAKARRMAMWRLSRETRLSTTQIGRMFGGRDHSSVSCALKKAETEAAGRNVAA